MRRFKLVGLTGTTGAGKGEVRRSFVRSGWEVIDADLLAREIMTDGVVPECLCAFFGSDIMNGGELNRSLLAERAFASREKTELLNRITHPFISALFARKVRDLSESGCNNILFDAPQLFESGLDVFCDLTVGVVADPRLRAERIRKRDGLTEAQAMSRISVQLGDEFFIKNCDCVIENDSTLESLYERAEELVRRLGSELSGI